MKNILITGGYGFIGSRAIRFFIEKGYNVVNLDNMTYAAQAWLTYDLDEKFISLTGDICDSDLVYEILRQHKIDTIINFAAESHVDNAISGPMIFQQTNYIGTATLLEEARKYWKEKHIDGIFYQVSTDEVFGSLPLDMPSEKFNEYSKLNPRSPYSASKAAAEMLVMSYRATYGMKCIISNCSNNYGPGQHKEKLIPKVINSCMNREPIPIYGDGLNVRDWLYVDDHIDAIYYILSHVDDWYDSDLEFTMRFCIGGYNELSNNKIVNTICNIYDKIVGNKEGESNNFIIYVNDRLGHDRRYAIQPTKLELAGWHPSTKFEDGIEKTVRWYIDELEHMRNNLSK